jgi:isopenicillin N synthase-like dioxygenase
LDVEEDFFKDKTKQSAAILRGLHYPPQPPKDTNKAQALGIGAHTE